MDKTIYINSGAEPTFPVKVINKTEEAYIMHPSETFKGAEMDSLTQAIRFTQMFMQNEANARIAEQLVLEAPLPETMRKIIKGL